MEQPVEVDDEDFDPDGPADDGNPMGWPNAEITLAVDVSAFSTGSERRRGPPQPGDRHRVLRRDARRRCSPRSFGTEWFIEKGVETARAPAGLALRVTAPLPRPPRSGRRRLGRRPGPGPRRRRARRRRRPWPPGSGELARSTCPGPAHCGGAARPRRPLAATLAGPAGGRAARGRDPVAGGHRDGRTGGLAA